MTIPRKAAFLAAGILAVMLFAPTASAQFYKQTNLVSDLPGMAPLMDPLLVNPWGMSSSSASPLWVSNAGTSTSTIYAINPTTGAVTVARPPVTIPAPPSGQLFNGTGLFPVSAGGASGSAIFIFSDLNGTISGWNPNVPAAGSNVAEIAATGAPAPAAYTGITMALRGTDPFLFAANNAAGRIDMFDKNFVQVPVPAGAFTDTSLPTGDKPFDIANIGGNLYVTYNGPVGVVNEFDVNGTMIRRFATDGGLLNPWGLAVAPADFGKFSNALLVGNFNRGIPATGPGLISAYDLSSGALLGILLDTSGHDISIDGLWQLKFGNGGSGGATNVLYFSAGIQAEMHGLLGSLSACHGPVIHNPAASPNVLWPPNHKFVPVTISYTVTDDCVAVPTCTLSVTSNEGAGDNGSGNTSPDAEVVDAHHVNLRAERDGGGNGRVYTVKISCTDSLPLSSSANVTVTVPHDQGH